MSDQASSNNKNDQKAERQYLTLADKTPSVLLSGTVSPRSISTRELSDNLQKTRDGLMSLMKKQGGGNDRFRARRGSDSGTEDDENSDFQCFNMPIRNRQPGRGGNAQQSGGELDSSEMMNGEKKFGKYGGTTSKDLANTDPSNVSSSEELRNGGRMRGKGRFGGVLGEDTDGINGGKGFNKEYDERFSSQNPKKDGPLHTRIFIDAFLPSLEGNRIFPLFNHRCAEKIERSSKDYYERNRKLTNKQLPAVKTEESLETHESHLPKEKREVNKVEGMEAFQKEEELQKVVELQKVEEPRKVVEVPPMQKLKEMQKADEIRTFNHSNEEIEVVALHIVEKIQTLRKAGELQSVEEIHDLHRGNEMVEVIVLESVEERQEEIVLTLATAEENLQENQKTSNKKTTDVPKNVVQSNPVKQEKVLESVPPASNADPNVEVSHRQVEKPSAEEEKLMQKVMHVLLANEELIDIFCDKVIAKLAARNDFCGPNCNSTCGGLNKK